MTLGAQASWDGGLATPKPVLVTTERKAPAFRPGGYERLSANVVVLGPTYPSLNQAGARFAFERPILVEQAGRTLSAAPR